MLFNDILYKYNIKDASRYFVDDKNQISKDAKPVVKSFFQQNGDLKKVYDAFEKITDMTAVKRELSTKSKEDLNALSFHITKIEGKLEKSGKINIITKLFIFIWNLVFTNKIEIQEYNTAKIKEVNHIIDLLKRAAPTAADLKKEEEAAAAALKKKEADEAQKKKEADEAQKKKEAEEALKKKEEPKKLRDSVHSDSIHKLETAGLVDKLKSEVNSNPLKDAGLYSKNPAEPVNSNPLANGGGHPVHRDINTNPSAGTAYYYPEWLKQNREASGIKGDE